jgi:hypothetical protein
MLIFFNPDADIPELLILQQFDKVLYKWFTAMHSDEITHDWAYDN